MEHLRRLAEAEDDADKMIHRALTTLLFAHVFLPLELNRKYNKHSNPELKAFISAAECAATFNERYEHSFSGRPTKKGKKK